MARAEVIFFAFVLTMMWVVSISDIGGSGLAATPPNEVIIPHVDMLSPDRNAELYSPTVKFFYRPKSVDYDVTCTLMLNDEAAGSQLLAPGQLGEFQKHLAEGRYDWRINCKLLNGRTISSPARTFDVNPHEDFNQFAPTGRVVSGPIVVSTAQSLVTTMVILALVIWAVVIYREKR